MICGLLIFSVSAENLTPPLNLMPNGNFETAKPADPKQASGWLPVWNGYSYINDPVNSWSGSMYISLTQTGTPTSYAAARQRVTLNQKIARPVRVTAMMLGVDIIDNPNDKFGACLYGEIHLVNGQIVYTENTAKTKSVGSFDWKETGWNTASMRIDSPIAYIDVFPFLGKTAGRVWFDDVFVEDLASELGTSAVTIMFDDGYKSVSTVALPEMDKYGWKGTAAIVSGRFAARDPNYLTLAEVKNLYLQSGWTIASHGVNHMGLATLSPTQMEDELYDSLVFFHANGIETSHFVLPFGDYNASIWAVAQWYYDSMRGTDRADNPYGFVSWDVRIQEAQYSTTSADISLWLTHAKANNRWLILLFHDISTSAGTVNRYAVTPTFFRQTMSLVKDSGIQVMTYDDAFAKYSLDPRP